MLLTGTGTRMQSAAQADNLRSLSKRCFSSTKESGKASQGCAAYAFVNMSEGLSSPVSIMTLSKKLSQT